MEKFINNRGAQIRKVTFVGIITNISLAFIKIFAGIYANSQTVIADGIHSFSDLITDFGIIVGEKLWSKPKDDGHPYGHGRIEQLVTILIGIVLALTSIGIAYNAITTIEENHFIVPGYAALIAALMSVIVKELLYRWSAVKAKEIKSSALLANAWHHRSDAISSIPAFIAVALAILYKEWSFIDHVGAVIVSLIIFHASLKIIFPSINQLVDRAPPKKLRDEVMEVVKRHTEVKSAHELRTRYLGPSVAIDLHIQVNPFISVKEGHDIAEHVTLDIKEDIPEISDVVVHIEPYGED